MKINLPNEVKKVIETLCGNKTYLARMSEHLIQRNFSTEYRFLLLFCFQVSI